MRYRTNYKVTLGALPIARASFVTEMDQARYTITGSFNSSAIVDIITEMDQARYTITGSFNSSAIVDIITKISARTNITGTLSGDRMQADRYTLVYQSGKKKQTYDVRYRNGDVTETVVHPEPKRRPSNWIAVGPEDLKSVLDPISGLIIPEGEAACPRTLPIYDGESRMDLVLTPKGRERYKINDVESEAIVCAIRYVPKSGFRKGRKDIEYLRKVEGMEIWFAKTATRKVYAPVYARVPTQMGTIYVSAVEFDG